MSIYFMDITVRAEDLDAYYTVSHKIVKADSVEELIRIIEDTYDGVIRNNLAGIERHDNFEKYLKDFTGRRVYERYLRWLDVSQIYEVENEPIVMDPVLELTVYSLKERTFSSNNQFYRILKTHPTPKIIPDPTKYEAEIEQARKRLLPSPSCPSDSTDKSSLS